MRQSVSNSITETVRDLYVSGLIDEMTMHDITAMCVPEYSPRSIVKIRKKLKLSQSGLARLLNVTLATVREWEKGRRKPGGASMKLLSIAEKKGAEGLV